MTLRFVVAALLLLAGPGCKKAEDTAPPTEAPAKTADADDEDDDEEEEEESPYLDATNFNRKIEEHTAEIVACWLSTAGKEADAPTGRVRTTVVVGGQGDVSKVMFDDQRSDLKHDGLYKCITEKVKALKFNITLTGGDSPMPYTFDLRKGELLPE